ncbi:MAG: carbohydrate deacetylase [Myxococcota bacterium]
MRYLIVHANDLGLSSAVTDGILEAFTHGLLTSTSLLMGAPDAPRAARRVKSCPRLGVGLHLALCDVRPILSPRRIPSLMGSDGLHFPDAVTVQQRLEQGLLSPHEILLELEAQLLAAQDMGLSLTHVDGHHHLHMHPHILPGLLELLRQHQIPALRIPRREPGLKIAPTLSALRSDAHERLPSALAGMLEAAGLLTTDHFMGLETQGCWSMSQLLERLSALPEGTTELMLSPQMVASVTPASPAFFQAHAPSPDLTPPESDLFGSLDTLDLADPRLAALLRHGSFELIHYGDLPGLSREV